ncbi:Nicotinate-nucleotide--dimethylbenzimidazole phosphoribosyltransferase [Acidipropionibacterium virtanenii]|uniref:Nicotinate-nucleotide--dimethylbenzimidazole phosphoribosyltransferase n=1 Tax=Acidipropionibacterium virtanenii TaxID=2057246 RepID=A0A344UWC6_9ACTN|nr:Nicotinate-nucleotide--dimethylbenzimidazole phosphoribosyltransferase [Acidipropionibacterium virtanenii]
MADPRLPGALAPDSLLARTVTAIRPADPQALAAAHDRQQILTKPEGSLGQLEALSIRLAGMSSQLPVPVPSHPVVGLFAGDHGVWAQGVSPDPQEITAQMAGNMAAGGAGISVLSAQMGARVWVTDVGVATALPAGSGVRDRNVRRSTDDISQGPAMTLDEAIRALEVGIETADEAVAQGADILITGEMGIANTTPAAALISLFTGLPVDAVTGRGAGADSRRQAHKISVIQQALDVNRPDAADPVGALTKVGGFEHAAMAGLVLGAAAHRVPVVIDGVIACSSALLAIAIAPDAADFLVPGHAGAEPGITAALERLGLPALLDLGLRLGEGTGAVLALPIIQAAAHILNEMATFEDAAVTDIKVTGEIDLPADEADRIEEGASR